MITGAKLYGLTSIGFSFYIIFMHSKDYNAKKRWNAIKAVKGAFFDDRLKTKGWTIWQSSTIKTHKIGIFIEEKFSFLPESSN